MNVGVTGKGTLRSRQRLGKYRIERQLAEGGFATVYRAMDTVEGIRVALKVPRAELVSGREAQVTHEVRLAARLDHPNVLPVKNAQSIDGVFVIAYPLGEKTLGDRMASRLSAKRALEYFEQMLEAVANAHKNKVIHCDLKPENFILFRGDRVRLTDFGIAKIALATRSLSGSGTIGYIAPEQALGRPSLRSDVFSLALMAYRMFTGELPEWPFNWPPPGIGKLRATIHPDFVELLRRCLEVDEKKRPADATKVLAAFRRLRSRALKPGVKKKRTSSKLASPSAWRTVRLKEFMRRYGKPLMTRANCEQCHGPTAESMLWCPWCGKARPKYAGPSEFKARCQRCGRGRKSDWRYCAFCWGPAFKSISERKYSDKRYTAHCEHCAGGLMPFMRYCPWCHRKVAQQWEVHAGHRCKGCGWGVLDDYWDFCPWCGRKRR
ncbi:MAG: protein kinase [Polyangiaceae bacterium]